MLCQAWADWREARAFIRREGERAERAAAKAEGREPVIPCAGATTYVLRDKDGNVTAVREFPQVAAGRKAEALYLRLLADLRIRDSLARR